MIASLVDRSQTNTGLPPNWSQLVLGGSTVWGWSEVVAMGGRMRFGDGGGERGIVMGVENDVW